MVISNGLLGHPFFVLVYRRTNSVCSPRAEPGLMPGQLAPILVVVQKYHQACFLVFIHYYQAVRPNNLLTIWARESPTEKLLPNCPFQRICMASIPEIVLAAVCIDWNPKQGCITFLINRWSCSTILFRYFTGLISIFSGKIPALFSCSSQQDRAGFLSTLMRRGVWVWLAFRTFLKKRLAALASRLARSKKSRVFPSLSTARYK